MDKSYAAIQPNELLKKIRFEITKDDGSSRLETLWGVELASNRFRVANIPIHADSVSLDDIVMALPDPAGSAEVIFQRVVKKSGNRTVRAYFHPPVSSGNQSDQVLQKILARGCTSEAGMGGSVCINVPVHVVLYEICECLTVHGVGWEPGDPSLDELNAAAQPGLLGDAESTAPVAAFQNTSFVSGEKPGQQDETSVVCGEPSSDGFRAFFHEMPGKLSFDQLDGILPIRFGPVPCGLKPYLYPEYWRNWSEFAAGFSSAVMWLQRLYADLPEAEVKAKFASLSDDEKGFVQRGYQILHEGRFPPFTDVFMYDIDIEVDDVIPKSYHDFPSIFRYEPEEVVWGPRPDLSAYND